MSPWCCRAPTIRRRFSPATGVAPDDAAAARGQRHAVVDHGASSADYTNALTALNGLGITVIGDATGSGGYVTSQESRTIWVQLTAQQFDTFFGTPWKQAYSEQQQATLYYWDNGLSVPDGLNVQGVWFDTWPIWGTYPAVSDMSGGARVTPPQGPLSIGNNLYNTSQSVTNYAGDIADRYYNFPLAGIDAPTATIGLSSRASAVRSRRAPTIRSPKASTAFAPTPATRPRATTMSWHTTVRATSGATAPNARSTSASSSRPTRAAGSALCTPDRASMAIAHVQRLHRLSGHLSGTSEQSGGRLLLVFDLPRNRHPTCPSPTRSGSSSSMPHCATSRWSRPTTTGGRAGTSPTAWRTRRSTRARLTAVGRRHVLSTFASAPLDSTISTTPYSARRSWRRWPATGRSGGSWRAG